MKIKIVGEYGAFGSFLKELLGNAISKKDDGDNLFTFCDDADSVILAVPISAYDDVASKHKGKHLINVCSVQKPSTDICLKHSDRVTSIHPLFGRRTPPDKRNSILTYIYSSCNDTWFDDQTENDFLDGIRQVCTVWRTGARAFNNTQDICFTPESHDILMAKTHVAAVMAAKQLKVYTDRVNDVPDELIPNSFRLMREFVKTLDDMPHGTIESIMANPFV